MDLPKLFEVPIVEQGHKSGPRCRSCKHTYRHQYGRMVYCSNQLDKKTAYGNIKIKSNAYACQMYEPKEVVKDV